MIAFSQDSCKPYFRITISIAVTHNSHTNVYSVSSVIINGRTNQSNGKVTDEAIIQKRIILQYDLSDFQNPFIRISRTIVSMRIVKNNAIINIST